MSAEILWTDSDRVDSEGEAALAGADGILVPGGFGIRGVEGMIRAIGIARAKRIPFLGICLGLQCAVIEFARAQAGLDRAHSTEFERGTPHPVIDLLPGPAGEVGTGGTMRLGEEEILLRENSLAAGLYGAGKIRERHRHRYEVAASYRARLEKAGLVFSGTSAGGKSPEGLVEVIEIPDHPYFVAAQFHPEFTSRPLAPSPLFLRLVSAAAR